MCAWFQDTTCTGFHRNRTGTLSAHREYPHTSFVQYTYRTCRRNHARNSRNILCRIVFRQEPIHLSAGVRLHPVKHLFTSLGHFRATSGLLPGHLWHPSWPLPGPPAPWVLLAATGPQKTSPWCPLPIPWLPVGSLWLPLGSPGPAETALRFVQPPIGLP